MNKTVNFMLHHINSIYFSWFLVLLLIEGGLSIFVSGRISNKCNRFVKNLSLGLINRFILPLATLPILVYVTSKNLAVEPSGLPDTIGILLDILILDFFSYVFHVLSHRYNFLWRFHSIHHSDEVFDAATGLRIHYFELIIANIFRLIPIVLFSIPLNTVLLFQGILILTGLFHHSSIKIPKLVNALLKNIITVPETHIIHHHAYQPETDSNFGFIFIWWDKLFDTYIEKPKLENNKIGLDNQSHVSMFDLLVRPFLRAKNL